MEILLDRRIHDSPRPYTRTRSDAKQARRHGAQRHRCKTRATGYGTRLAKPLCMTQARGKRKTARRRARKWSADAMRRSDALDLEPDVFKSRSPAKIAASLKRSAERSKRRKGTPLQSAMSMLNFYINRAGRNVSPARKRLLERAKPELRKAFGREPRA
jgi:hypothetical protein